MLVMVPGFINETLYCSDLTYLKSVDFLNIERNDHWIEKFTISESNERTNEI